ncbi:MAG: YopX family protein [Cyclobacteriaceae bacterium]|jgi:hypothetical protein|nr:YopX family protein [Cyclobacteriaceae bacterium]
MQFKKRILKFKAWDIEHKLLMRLDSIECNKGELIKPNHILLQFTGLYDKDGQEIYEMDVLLDNLQKYVVIWSEEHNSWYFSKLNDDSVLSPIGVAEAIKMKRFCNYFESDNNAESF